VYAKRRMDYSVLPNTGAAEAPVNWAGPINDTNNLLIECTDQ